MTNRIFLMDDESKELEHVQELLESRLPVQVVPISDSDAGLQLIRTNASAFAAYILDIEMVGQTYCGIQIAEEIRRQPGCALVPILFLTSRVHFGGEALRYIHYYDFLPKPCDAKRLIGDLRSALALDNAPGESRKAPIVLLEGRGTSLRLDLSMVSCLEISGQDMLITDFRGQVTAFPIKPRTFSKLCAELDTLPGHAMVQVHRSVIINRNRIRAIEWRKNSATIWLFNVADWKPAGKNYLDNLAIFRK